VNITIENIGVGAYSKAIDGEEEEDEDNMQLDLDNLEK